jgi:hypothetical protein
MKAYVLFPARSFATLRAASRFPASPNGEKRVSLSIVAIHVLALRHPQKPPAARRIHGVVESA